VLALEEREGLKALAQFGFGLRIPGADAIDPQLLGISEQIGLLSTGLSIVGFSLHYAAWRNGRSDAGPKLWLDGVGIVLGLAAIGGSYKLARAVLAPEQRAGLSAALNFAAGMRGVESGWPGLSTNDNSHPH
jgi:hypothetical protein